MSLKDLDLFNQEQVMVPQQGMTQYDQVPYAVSQQKTKDKGVIEFQLDSSHKLAKLKQSLIGGYYDNKRLDKDNNPVFIRTGQAITNEPFADLLINLIMEAVSGKEIYQSIMSENELLATAKDITDMIIRKLWNRKLRAYGGIQTQFVDFIKAGIENSVVFLIKRSLNGETSKQINSNINVNESNLQQQMGGIPKQSRFSGLFGGN